MRLTRKMLPLAGAFLIVVAVLLLIIAYQGLRFANYQKNGVVTQAIVARKYTSRTLQIAGSSLYRTNFLLAITFSTAKQTGSIRFITAEAQADENSVRQLSKGDQIQIVYLPDDPQHSAVLPSVLEAGILEESQLSLYRQKGVTVPATVSDVDSSQQMLEVMFMTSLLGAEGDFVSTTLKVSKEIWDAVNQGERIEVIYLPQDPKNNVVAQKMVAPGSINPYLFSGLALIACAGGIGLMRKYGRLRENALPR